MARTRSESPSLILFEDSQAAALAPLSLLRPVFDIKVGVLTLREKLEAMLGTPATHTIVRKYLRESDAPVSSHFLPDGTSTFLINGRVISDLSFASQVHSMPLNSILEQHGTIVAAHLDAIAWSKFSESENDMERLSSLPATATTVTMLNAAWDVVRHLEKELIDDLHAISRISVQRGNLRIPALKSLSPISYKSVPTAAKAPAGSHFLRPRGIRIGKRTRIYPDVVINAEKGMVVIGSDCTVLPFTYIEGPCFIGDGALVKSHTSIVRSSIGEECRVSGEIRATTMHAFVNKQHEGFAGNSYFAPWINIGAGTITSNLKNTYGPVRVHRDGIQVDTGMQFLGTIAGDHSMFGINTMLNTGTIIGVGCNVVGAGFPAKELPSFRWGADGEIWDFAKFILRAHAVMARREQTLTPHDTAILAAVYRQATGRST